MWVCFVSLRYERTHRDSDTPLILQQIIHKHGTKKTQFVIIRYLRSELLYVSQFWHNDQQANEYSKNSMHILSCCSSLWYLVLARLAWKENEVCKFIFMNALKGGITLEILACKVWLRDRKRPHGREKKTISRPMRALRALSICQHWFGYGPVQ